MEQELSPEDMKILKQAKESKAQLDTLGAMTPKEPTPAENNSSPEPNDGVLEEEKQYETFVDVTNLPSKGKFYNGSIKGQPMKVPDLILIQGITDQNLMSRFNEIFGRRIRGIDPGDILLVDEYYISLWLRATTFPDYPFPYKAYECKKCKLKVPADRAEFDFRHIQVNTDIDEVAKLFDGKYFVEKELPMSKERVIIHLKRRKHATISEVLLNEYYYDNDKLPPEGAEELINLLSVVQIGEISNLADIIKYVHSSKFNPIDFVELIKMVNKHSIDEEIVVNFTCPDSQCKEVTPMTGYPFSSIIYLPVYTDRRLKTDKN